MAAALPPSPRTHATRVHGARSSNASLGAPLPPLVMLKTHKTGGTTLQWIVEVVGSRRGAKLMPPPCGHRYSGWSFIAPFPGPFCGACGHRCNATYRRHGYDIVHHHSVLDVPHMRQFLRPSARRPFFLTVLREPVSRVVSSFNYRPWLHVARGAASSRTANWSTIVAEYEKFTHTSLSKNAVGAGGGIPLFRNSMSLDLGWYSRNGTAAPAFKHDHDDAQLRTWLRGLDKKLDLVMLMERFDEGLVLLAQMLGLPVREFAYRVRNNAESSRLHRPPFPASLRQRLLRINWPDYRLYAHFEARFCARWNATDSEARRDGLATLEAANVPVYHMEHSPLHIPIQRGRGLGSQPGGTEWLL